MARRGLFCPSSTSLVAASLAACFLAGCNAVSQTAIPASADHLGGGVAPARMHAAACGKSIVYVTSYNNTVQIYDQEHAEEKPCGQITGVTNLQGIFVDNKKNLWVAISGNCKTVFSRVLEFAPGGSTPEKTLKDTSGPATAVAVDDKTGTVYVTNFYSYSSGCGSGKAGAVEVYPKGSTTPTSTLTDPNMQYAFSDAVDDQGNVYVTYGKVGTPAGGGILLFTKGLGSGTDLGISLKNPAGIQTTKNGALLVCDQQVGCGDFEPGSKTMTKMFATQKAGAYGVALDKPEKNAWVENPAITSGQLQQYKYPGPDTQPEQSITVTGGGYAGVALSPPAPEGHPY